MPPPVLGVIGQAAPGAGANGNLYTVPAARRAVLSTIAVANTGGAYTTYRVHVRPGGAAAAAGNAIAYEVGLDAGQSDLLTLGVTIAAGDVVSVRSVSGAVTFTAFGEETDIPAA
jgi:pyruvate/2-oxoacid:ferredoxin oxidoreductase beta subunit